MVTRQPRPLQRCIILTHGEDSPMGSISKSWKDIYQTSLPSKALSRTADNQVTWNDGEILGRERTTEYSDKT